jgi:glutamate racemase
MRRVLEKMGRPLRIVDSAKATAAATARLVAERFPDAATIDQARRSFFATDSVAKFQRLGANFLGQPLDDVTLVDLGG